MSQKERTETNKADALCDSIAILSWDAVNGGSMIQTLNNPGQGLYILSETRWTYYSAVCAHGRGPVESMEIHKKQGDLTMSQGTAVVLVRKIYVAVHTFSVLES